jgi:tetratricopeptide (TPR) repeat protein
MRLDTKYGDAYYGRGMLKLAAGDTGGAVSDFTKALSMNPLLPLAYANRGVALLAQGKEAEAEGDFRRAIQYAPWLREKIEASVAALKKEKR